MIITKLQYAVPFCWIAASCLCNISYLLWDCSVYVSTKIHFSPNCCQNPLKIASLVEKCSNKGSKYALQLCELAVNCATGREITEKLLIKTEKLALYIENKLWMGQIPPSTCFSYPHSPIQHLIKRIFYTNVPSDWLISSTARLSLISFNKLLFAA